MNDPILDTTDPMAELSAMTEIAKALQPLDSEAVRRVLSWAADRFGVTLSATPAAKATFEDQNEANNGNRELDTVADLFAAANPKNDPERALLTAYWFQALKGQPDFDSASINRELKHLGHKVTNITAALSSLMSKKPQLVIQTRKSGSSQQARKRYKVTNEGLKYAERLLRGEELVE